MTGAIKHRSHNAPQSQRERHGLFSKTLANYTETIINNKNV